VGSPSRNSAKSCPIVTVLEALELARTQLLALNEKFPVEFPIAA